MEKTVLLRPVVRLVSGMAPVRKEASAAKSAILSCINSNTGSDADGVSHRLKAQRSTQDHKYTFTGVTPTPAQTLTVLA